MFYRHDKEDSVILGFTTCIDDNKIELYGGDKKMKINKLFKMQNEDKKILDKKLSSFGGVKSYPLYCNFILGLNQQKILEHMINGGLTCINKYLPLK